MKLVLIGLVMIANVHMYSSDDDSDFVVDEKPYSNPLSDVEYDQSKLIDKNKCRRYHCPRCDHENYYTGRAKHMHNDCFKTALPCRDCKSLVAPKMEKVGQIYMHNRFYHFKKSKWTCLACYAKIEQDKFIEHFGTHTFKENAIERFSDINDDTIKISQYKTPLTKLRQQAKMPKETKLSPKERDEGFLGFFQFLDTVHKAKKHKVELSDKPLTNSVNEIDNRINN